MEYIQRMNNFLDIQARIEAEEGTIMVLDDQMSEAGKLQDNFNLFSKVSQHRNRTAV